MLSTFIKILAKGAQACGSIFFDMAKIIKSAIKIITSALGG